MKVLPVERYRFTLQFPGQTSEQVRVGDFLKRLGNRKSVVIVAAINEYLDKHDIRQDKTTISVEVTQPLDNDVLRGMIRKVINEEFSERAFESWDDAVNDVADSMLEGLDAFL